LYVHVPFCVSKCLYCDFYSLRYSEMLAQDFLEALEKDIESSAEGLQPETIYIGGGTPTSLSNRLLRELLDIIARHVSLERVTEYTIEANPGTIDSAKLDIVLSAGVDRVSLGVQSFQEGTLKALGRAHSMVQALEAITLLRDKAVANVSIDLIYGIPGQTVKAVENDLERAIAASPEHVSFYGLLYESDTELTRQVHAGRIHPVSEHAEAKMYETIRNEMTSSGYHHYEISNFAKQGRECRHNLVYWHNDQYIGVGPSAASHVAGRRFCKTRNVQIYIDRLANGESPVCECEELGPRKKLAETLMLGLRLVDGIDLQEVEEKTGVAPLALFSTVFEEFSSQGLLDLSANRLRLTQRGMLVADSVMQEFFE